VQYNTVKYNTIQCSTIQYSTVQYNKCKCVSGLPSFFHIRKKEDKSNAIIRQLSDAEMGFLHPPHFPGWAGRSIVSIMFSVTLNFILWLLAVCKQFHRTSEVVADMHIRWTGDRTLTVCLSAMFLTILLTTLRFLHVYLSALLVRISGAIDDESDYKTIVPIHKNHCIV
jgi:hypothetical protein